MTEQEKWEAVITNNGVYDGLFYYGVVTTSVYCRPSCRSKKPRQENIVFFESPESAAKAGFRPCKRCRPDMQEYSPSGNLCRQAKRILDGNYKDMTAIKALPETLGVNEAYLSRLFRKEYGFGPRGYVHSLRVGEAKRLIISGSKIADAAFECGYGSISSFYSHFCGITGMTPKQVIAKDIKGET